MTVFRRYADFTAQSFNVRSLMRLYGELEQSEVLTPNLIPFVVFLAFSVESYVNSIGARQLSYWDELERLPWKNKIEILHKVAERSADWGKEPLQFASEIFRLRDKLAHGKPERVLGAAFDSMMALNSIPQSELEPIWYRGITKEWVLDAKERFQKLMAYLGNLFALHESDYLRLSTGGVLKESDV